MAGTGRGRECGERAREPNARTVQLLSLPTRRNLWVAVNFRQAETNSSLSPEKWSTLGTALNAETRTKRDADLEQEWHVVVPSALQLSKEELNDFGAIIHGPSAPPAQ
jgi:hypothetical protein